MRALAFLCSLSILFSSSVQNERKHLLKLLAAVLGVDFDEVRDEVDAEEYVLTLDYLTKVTKIP